VQADSTGVIIAALKLQQSPAAQGDGISKQRCQQP
jgi:hypothetical protein